MQCHCRDMMNDMIFPLVKAPGREKGKVKSPPFSILSLQVKTFKGRPTLAPISLYLVPPLDRNRPKRGESSRKLTKITQCASKNFLSTLRKILRDLNSITAAAPGGRLLPRVDYTRRLFPKGVPFYELEVYEKVGIHEIKYRKGDHYKQLGIPLY